MEWYPWGPEALEKAQKEDKPIIVSIGYSACHWCHVMERESFENEDIAALMNHHFVNIKVDREERPDIDAIYMEAVQAMGMQGGWPLNAFLTPEAKPFYAGTYFPPRNWAELLQKIARVFQNEREGLEESAENFRAMIARSEMEKYGLDAQDNEFPLEALDDMVAGISPYFDEERGGMQKAPKFPMPSIYAFLLQYSQLKPSSDLKKQALGQVALTLQEMAWGGIYDQIRGGFARYSVDGDWLVPHFEKMLYDNGQLISLYAQAYQVNPLPLYKDVVYQSIHFVARELRSPEGGFYSALDADSEGEEGKFYVWTFEEIETLFPDEQDRNLLIAYYKIVPEGNWEEGKNILHRRHSDEVFADQHQISLATLQEKIQQWQEVLLQARSKRIRPGLDDKILTSWNALMLKGLVDAY
ncbi:MAG: thioredoxin domain-containing protein, partial [Bacteroidota bacterium]